MGWENIYKKNLWAETTQCPELQEIFTLCQGKKGKVIDIGCAYGRIALPLAYQEFDVIGIDIAEIPINILKEKAKGLLNLQVFKGCFTALPFEDNLFDGCVAINSIYHGTFDNVKKAISEIERTLKQNGWFYGTFLSKEDWKYGRGRYLERDVFLLEEGIDTDIPHWFASRDCIEKLFCKWDVQAIYHNEVEYNSNISAHWVFLGRYPK